MSDQDIHPNKYSELRSIYKYNIDSYNALYQLKTENEEEINKIYKMLKTELIDSKKCLPDTIIRDILCIIPFNNRNTKAYFSLAKLIYDNYQINEEIKVPLTVGYLFYKEYGIKLNKSDNFETIKLENLDIHTENTIYRAIMNNDKEKFIFFTESEGFDKDQKLKSDLYPIYYKDYTLLELCCYHGAVDCFKFFRTKFDSKITEECLEFLFLGGNPEIMSECLKHKNPNKKCMEYAIISHNIDFVTFLVNEYNIMIDLEYCELFNNLDAFLVYYDQTNDIQDCFVYSIKFGIPSLCEYFLLHGANINDKCKFWKFPLHYAAYKNNKEIAELLISHGAKINEKDKNGNTALHHAALIDSEETAELLISHGAIINEKDKNGETPLHFAAKCNKGKETAELLISHGAIINEKDKKGETALHIAALNNSIKTAEVLISHGANIHEKDKYGKTALHHAAYKNNKEITELLISHGSNINEKDNDGKTILHCAAMNNNKEIAELLISHGAIINEKDKNGETPLHFAAKYNCKDTYELLTSEKSSSSYCSML
ncbi:hypothetical protein TVAG_029320 [Trichomonas vaginalis G3]|uniref:DUF3447 domain-containing protein n=1 Tax=Trichomonas vaginalis (strain ATCC PRA-98 / G3) TaxID=412133 RepID=A2F524_TRIV3|nr:ankyrin repeat and SOCS box-containing protein 4 family [Trichomonas vaginalis G3]EAY00028.1 hypothetical protein TVAG_029320 [Trichomonas vaginalis G3]KAI5523529.1 ankyrin repeat and SOCS box-containing protein 4 family [Trichomonas vaginalis G3]|eukprot:XP_001312957.1 hypothetical protein [Trichomonas vaginalis G3]